MDPRIEAIQKRLQSVDKLIPVASGKGGVGKSLISTTTALISAQKGNKVGLLDLDLHGPSDHIILGIDDYNFPEEEKGVLPKKVEGIKFMSTIYYSQDKPAPLRGEDISEAIRELLSITRWEDLDHLIIDMPPGTGNETLDTIQLIPESEFIVITTPSKMAVGTVKKLIRMLKELNIPIAGVIENMKTENTKSAKTKIENMEVPHLGEIKFNQEIEKKIGEPEKILESDFAGELKKSLPEL